MNSRRNPRRMLVALLAGLLVGGGLLSTTPAGAQVAEAASTNWAKIWTKKLQPQADKRYHTKAVSDATYATKAQSAAAAAAAQAAANAATDAKLGGYYTKAQSDANTYTKAQSDGRYRSQLGLVRGSWIIEAPNSTEPGMMSLSFGVTLSSAPTVHYIAAGAAAPAGCSGNASAPGADPGHLCVFESGRYQIGTPSFLTHSGFGSTLYAFGTSSTWGYAYGSYAVKPGALATGTGFAESGKTTSEDLHR